MHDNTPPRVPDIEEDDGEIIILDHDDPPLDDDEDDEQQMVEAQDFFDHLLDGSDSEGRRSPVEDISEFTFSLHSRPVYGCSLHPEYDLVVTGGEDDKAFVWNFITGDLLHEFDNHKDTITEVHFSHDGKYLAVGDLAGELDVLRFNDLGTELRVVWQSTMGDMAWMLWHRHSNVLFAGSDNGEVFIWRIPSGDCRVLPGAGSKCEAGVISGDGKKLFTSYGDGALKLWDLKQRCVIMEVDNRHPLAHTEMVTAVACHKESPVYMSGGQDEKVIFCSNLGVLGAVNTEGPVECVGFSPGTQLNMAASGTLHGQIAIWDFNKYSIRTVCEHPELDDGITELSWISAFTLVVGTIQGNIYGYDARTGSRKFSLTGHIGIIYQIKHDPRNNMLLSVSDDHTAKVFKMPDLGE